MAKTEPTKPTTFTYAVPTQSEPLPVGGTARLAFLYDLSPSTKSGVIPAGFILMRADTRSAETLKASGGFAPLYPAHTGTTVEYAREHARGIINLEPSGFISAWKQPITHLQIKNCGLEYIIYSVVKTEWRGKLAKCKYKNCNLPKAEQTHCPNSLEASCNEDKNWIYYNRMGVACGITGDQMGGNTYKITIPSQMYKLMNHTNGKSTVCIYGNGTTLKNSTVIGMHLKGFNIDFSEEFVFLTPVPSDWISVQNNTTKEWSQI